MSFNLLHNESVPMDTLRLWIGAGRLYAVVDACDAPMAPPKMESLGAQAVSLYRGMAEEAWSSFAPYLAQVDDALLNWILAALWQEVWGIFIVTEAGLHSLRAHLRHFLIVDDPQSEPMYFRFYDPRVLKKFLPTCSAKELQQLYGENEAFLIADPADTKAVQSVARVPGAWSPTPATHRIGQRFGIRLEQMAVFGQEAEAAFEVRLVKHLRAKHAEAVGELPDTSLRRMACAGIARARRYGITWESHVTAYVALMFEIAPNWDEHPRMQMTLASRAIPPEKKMDEVIARTPEFVWQEVSRHYDANAWSEPHKETA